MFVKNNFLRNIFRVRHSDGFQSTRDFRPKFGHIASGADAWRTDSGRRTPHLSGGGRTPDTNGRPPAMKWPDSGHPWLLAGARGRTPDMVGVARRSTSLLHTVTIPDGATQTVKYDAFGRPGSVARPGIATVRYSCDPVTGLPARKKSTTATANSSAPSSGLAMPSGDRGQQPHRPSAATDRGIRDSSERADFSSSPSEGAGAPPRGRCPQGSTPARQPRSPGRRFRR
jgi:YD repeat-containing protein